MDVASLKQYSLQQEVHFIWTDQGVISGMFRFLLLGEGNMPLMVNQLFRKAEPDPAKQPIAKSSQA
jgi:hypothetical protein